MDSNDESPVVLWNAGRTRYGRFSRLSKLSRFRIEHDRQGRFEPASVSTVNLLDSSSSESTDLEPEDPLTTSSPDETVTVRVEDEPENDSAR